MKLQGRVFRGSSGLYWVHVAHDPQPYGVRLRGTLKKELIYTEGTSRPRRVSSARKRRSTDPITVGDIVTFDTEQKVIESVSPRTSELARKSPSSNEQHVLVANLDRLFLVVAAARPAPDLWIIDRFLVVAENQEIETELVVNKCDLVDNMDDTEALFAPYAKIGYPINYVSARHSVGVDALRVRLNGRVGAFAGNSGVGKSSLLNAIQPGLRLKTGEVSTLENLGGRHTTTQAELIPILDGESWIADTPGLRFLDFWQIDEPEVEFGFREVCDRAHLCRFGNCTHRNEPGCAVRLAVDEGTIDERRWRSYVQLYDEAVERTASTLSSARSG